MLSTLYGTHGSFSGSFVLLNLLFYFFFLFLSFTFLSVSDLEVVVILGPLYP
jgi:hypothetical protein